ncbi:hypothetical protein ATCC90586_009129 [Pythium insidiosum]|nr:hypothetical protein ATCC90586_009129 [Pythium insidiosum]
MAKGKATGARRKAAEKAAADRQKQAQSSDDGMAAALGDLQLDPRGDGLYSGTFRWLESKKFPHLPSFPGHRQPNDDDTSAPVCLTKGWEGYLRSRGAEDLVNVAQRDPSCLDALSFPVSILHVLSLLRLMETTDDKASEERHIVVLGATTKAEQRVWRITDYWHELAHFFPQFTITLWFVGPEVSEHCPEKAVPSNLCVQHIRGTLLTLLQRPEGSVLRPDNTILVGFNTGFGNFVESQRYDLLFSWLPDLYAVADSGFPAIFTCANDYADMNGEFAVQSRVVGAKFLLLPMQNPFSAASHLHEEGKRETSWSRGNSFLYVIQGADKERRITLESGNVAMLERRLDDAALNPHIVDQLGRHFYRGMVLTKDQASRCKDLNGALSSSNQTDPPPSKLKTPSFQVLPGRTATELVVLVHVPDVKSTQERIAVDIGAASKLTVLIPGKYFLQTTLPFQVDERVQVQAAWREPFLQLFCQRVL